MYKTRERERERNTFSRRARPAFLSFLLPFLPFLLLLLIRLGRQTDHPADLSLPKEVQDSGGCSVILGSILMEGARERFHPHAFPTLFHILLLWGRQIVHLTKKWRWVCLSPLPHRHHSLDWFFILSAR